MGQMKEHHMGDLFLLRQGLKVVQIGLELAL